MKMWLAMQGCISQITMFELFIIEPAGEPYLGSKLDDEKTSMKLSNANPSRFQRIGEGGKFECEHSSQANTEGGRSPISIQSPFEKHIVPLSL